MRALERASLLCQIPEPEEPTRGLDAFVDGLGGRWRRRRSVTAGFRAITAAVVAMEQEWRDLADGALAHRLRELRHEVRRGKQSPELLAKCLAGIREAAARRLGLRPFPVQILGAVAMHHGCLAEMATGEGKTLTAGLAAVLAAWTGHPFHLITVNDYLAERDAARLKPLYDFCGVSVGHVTSPMDVAARTRGHAADITYTTSKEIVADFLRDRLRLGQWTDPARWRVHHHFRLRDALPDGVVMRGLHTAIIDEADSVLIDEAVTPLIISGQSDRDATRSVYAAVWELIRDFAPGVDYQVNRRHREVELRSSGRRQIAAAAETVGKSWRTPAHLTEMVEQALTARELFLRDKHYVVRDDEVIIVDEFTGRLMPNRKWRQGLHQAIEAKEGITISPMDTTLARLSFQRFFRFFHTLAGMTGTAWEVAGELWHIYRLPVVRIPTNRPCVRVHQPDRFFAAAEDKWRAIVAEITRVHAAGRPVLIGTRSVAASEELAARLDALHLSYALLNAVQDQHEAQIVAGAGARGRITIATNMAGRGTDIRLDDGVAELGGLHVIATERHESGRIDRQLFGRAARQGDPGSAQAFVSAEDELTTRFAARGPRTLFGQVTRHGVPGARVVGAATIAHAQRVAERQARHARTGVLRMDTWLDDAIAFSGRRVG